MCGSCRVAALQPAHAFCVYWFQHLLFMIPSPCGDGGMNRVLADVRLGQQLSQTLQHHGLATIQEEYESTGSWRVPPSVHYDEACV